MNAPLSAGDGRWQYPADTGGSAGMTDDLLVERLIETWLTGMRAAGHSPATLRTRRASLGSMRHAGVDPLTASTRDLQRWLSAYSGWTTVVYTASARAWFAHLVRSGVRADDPTTDLTRPHRPRRVPRPVSRDEVDMTLLLATGDVRAWVTLAAFAGLRCAEIAHVRGENVTREGLLVRGKGDREDIVPTHPRVWLLAQEYPRHGWWFPSPSRPGPVHPNTVSRALSVALRTAGVRATGHQLRHAFVTQVYQSSGRDLLTTQRLARHSNPATTAGYAAVADEQARAAVNAL